MRLHFATNLIDEIQSLCLAFPSLFQSLDHLIKNAQEQASMDPKGTKEIVKWVSDAEHRVGISLEGACFSCFACSNVRRKPSIAFFAAELFCQYELSALLVKPVSACLCKLMCACMTVSPRTS